MDPTLQTLHALRSTHGTFTDREVSDADLETVIAASTRAANASSRQAYSIILLESRDRMELLLGYRASRALVYCVDYHRLGLLAAHLGRTHDSDNVMEFVTGAVEVSLATQSAVVAARALGIDSLVTNGLHRRPLELVYRELGLPERSVFPVITVLLGYAEKSTDHVKRRLPLEHVLHRDRYRSPTAADLDQIVAAYDDRAARIGMVDLWDAKEYPHYLDWYFERWAWKPRGEPLAEAKLTEFQDRLRESGFWWPER